MHSFATYFDMFALGHARHPRQNDLEPLYNPSILNSDSFNVLDEVVPILEASCCFPEIKRLVMR